MDELVFVFAISPSKIQEENIFLEAQRLISKCDHLSSSRISVGISLWEMHILGPLSRPTNSETLELMPNNPFFEALQVVLTKLKYVVVVVVQCSFMSDSLRPYRLQHVRLPCPSPPPRACSNSCPSSRWCHPTVSPSVAPSPPAFYLLQHVFQWAGSWHQVAKVLEFQVHHQSFQRIFRVDFF